MRTAIVALFCSFLSLSAHPSDVGWSHDPNVRSYYADLLKAGGLGLTHWEAAAFLLLSPDGRYRCVAWPFSNRNRQQKYRGRIPEFTVAIIHTHPRNIPLPSMGDRATARRLGIPVIVLTSHNIYVATPDDRIVEVVRHNAWFDEIRGPATRCESPDEHSAPPRGR